MKVLTLEEMTGLRGPGICICERNQSGLHRNQITASNRIRFCVRLLVRWFLIVSTADSPPWDPEAKAPGMPRHLGVSGLPPRAGKDFSVMSALLVDPCWMRDSRGKRKTLE